MKYRSKQLTEKLKGLDKSLLELIQILDEIPDNAPDNNGSWTITDDEGNEITLSERNGKVTITTTRKTLNLTIEVLDGNP
jgi:nitrogen-specific signal transduction histidine kinase